MNETILEMRGIIKRYPGVTALNNVDFDLRTGEVHILMGENGAGKSTLGKVLLGFTPHDSGEIVFRGKTVHFATTKEALENGIVGVYQEGTLVPYLSVCQNIYLNREPRDRLGLLNIRKMENDARLLLRDLGCENINVRKKVKHLTVAEQQMVEIAKALSYAPQVIVFDEPTATLSELEVDALFAQIHKLRAKGIGIIYVSHRMDEFRRIGDRFTVLRDGKKIATHDLKDHTDAELVRMMVGREISEFYVHNCHAKDEVVLRADNLCGCGGKVKDVSFALKKGEILGLYGLVGSGRTETALLVYGIEKLEGGTITINGETLRNIRPVDMVRRGLGMLTEDRKRFGVALNDSIKWNTMGVSLKKYCPHLVLRNRTINAVVERYRTRLRIKSTSINSSCKSLSGGNLQKVVLAKWLAQDPQIFIFDEPTRGIDIGTKKEIYNLMDQLAAEGKSILMISSELPEITGMCDRIYVLREGRSVAEIDRGIDGFNSEQIGYHMLVGG